MGKKPFSITKVRKLNKWSKSDDNKLLSHVNFYLDKGQKANWKSISSNFDSKTPYQCYSRYYRIRPSIKHGKFSRDEDKIIINEVAKYGKKWRKISKKMSRYPKQIRDRYINYLDPNIHLNPFTNEEIQIIEEKVETLGRQWVEISKQLKGRTTNMIKNHFYSNIINHKKKNAVENNFFKADYHVKSFSDSHQNISYSLNYDNKSLSANIIRLKGDLLGDSFEYDDILRTPSLFSAYSYGLNPQIQETDFDSVFSSLFSE